MRWSQPSRSRAEAALLAAALIGVGLLLFPAPGQASPAPALPVVRTGVIDNITLYGAALGGWGYTANNTTNPGPHLRVSYGDTVQLTLIAADGATHTWFVDYNNNSIAEAGEHNSPAFSQPNSILWNFTADQVGTYVYRCSMHPTSMTGLITISAPSHYTLYGDALRGWGFNSSDLTKPGPTLVVQAGVNVTLTLYAVDSAAHTWFIDTDNSSSVGPGERQSGEFGGLGNPNPMNYSFNATGGGTFAYRCGIHLTTMWGMIVILGQPGPKPAGFPVPLIPGIMLAVIFGVLFFAAVYQVRAVRAARPKK